MIGDGITTASIIFTIGIFAIIVLVAVLSADSRKE